MKRGEEKILVSVCLPTYNGEAFLEEALESIYQQTYRPLELICSDDNSKDVTKKILQDFSKRADFPVVILDHKPRGIGSNWNNCLKRAKGEYIKFLFQDDVLDSSCIEVMVTEISGKKDIGLVTSKRRIILSYDRMGLEEEKWISEYGDLQKHFRKEGHILLDKRFFASEKFRWHPINKISEPSGILFRREILKKVGYFREDMIQILDVEFYSRVLKQCQILILDMQLYGFRLHEAQASSKNIGKDQNDFELYDRLLLKNYYWHLSHSTRIQLLDKFYPYLSRLYRFLLRKFERKKQA